MPYTFQGETFDSVPLAKLSPAEIDVVERLTGESYQKLTRRMQTCVCEHFLGEHAHFDDKGVLDRDDASCKSQECNCPMFAGDVSSRANFAMLFIALKRHKPDAKFEDVESVPQDEWVYEAGPDDVDPTQPSEAEVSPRSAPPTPPV